MVNIRDKVEKVSHRHRIMHKGFNLYDLANARLIMDIEKELKISKDKVIDDTLYNVEEQMNDPMLARELWSIAFVMNNLLNQLNKKEEKCK